MNQAITKSLASIGRRKFVGQVSAASAALMSGVLSLTAGERRVSGHQERLTMASAVAGREFGLITYRVRRTGIGGVDQGIVAVLLADGGAPLGDFARRRLFRQEFVPYTKTEDGVVEHYKIQKVFRKSERTSLRWAGQTIEIGIDDATGTFAIKDGPRHVGSVAVGPGEPSDPGAQAVHEFVDSHQDVMRVLGAVESDLNAAFPNRPQREYETCCCEVECIGPDQHCISYANVRSEACSQSEACVGTLCSNESCIGCCSLSSCNSACVCGDFICWADIHGTPCGCHVHCV